MNKLNNEQRLGINKIIKWLVELLMNGYVTITL